MLGAGTGKLSFLNVYFQEQSSAIGLSFCSGSTKQQDPEVFGGTRLSAVGFALCPEEVFSALPLCAGHCSPTASCSQLSDALEKKAHCQAAFDQCFSRRAKSPFQLFGFVSLQRDQPKMVMEYWTGWFDNWGGPHYVFDADGEHHTLLL